MRFSQREAKELWYAGLLISLAFAILLSGGYKAIFSTSSILIAFPIAFFTAGLGFLLHELAHKMVAQSYGYFAEFRAFYKGLWLALLFSLFGFIIAAPGAVMIRSISYLSREKSGKISIAGPITNIILAIIFLIPLLLFTPSGIFGTVFSYGLTINSLLAAFNMMPVTPFDGAKVIAWSKGIYFIALSISIGLFLVSWFV